ncbi:hypothetical protein [Gilliamella sp. wkB308]|uniref:hypothetical protein n=1 Tax=Gilliamella sp. wkB308 TaxID=3120263 RepID=UPI00080D9B0A|nr:hypothetical protein [Gilliamella apicola]OCF98862.1 hypothetical protein A9G10_06445 [Gilliamella apicola]
MQNAISINLNTAPFVTVDRYSELTGLPVETVKTHIKKGLIPTKKKPVSEKSSRTRTLINMFEISAVAASESKIKINLNFGG